METLTLVNTLRQMGLIDIYGTFQPKTAKYTLFSSAHEKFSKIDHVGHKKNLNKLKKSEIISSTFTDNNHMKKEIIYRNKTRKTHK